MFLLQEYQKLISCALFTTIDIPSKLNDTDCKPSIDMNRNFLGSVQKLKKQERQLSKLTLGNSFLFHHSIFDCIYQDLINLLETNLTLFSFIGSSTEDMVSMLQNCIDHYRNKASVFKEVDQPHLCHIKTFSQINTCLWCILWMPK